MININRKKIIKKGFTLVETLLYVAIISIILLVMSTFLFLILQAKTKFQVMSEVDQVGLHVIQSINYAVRNAKAVNIPSAGESGEILSIDMEDILKNPIIFNLSGDGIFLKEGAESFVSLSNSRVKVFDLTFYNTTKNNTSGSIKFKFTITYLNPSGRNEYEYTKTFNGSATLR